MLGVLLLSTSLILCGVGGDEGVAVRLTGDGEEQGVATRRMGDDAALTGEDDGVRMGEGEAVRSLLGDAGGVDRLWVLARPRLGLGAADEDADEEGAAAAEEVSTVNGWERLSCGMGL